MTYRYFVFKFPEFYPSGGWNDLHEDDIHGCFFRTVEDAVHVIERSEYFDSRVGMIFTFQIVDFGIGGVLWEGTKRSELKEFKENLEEGFE